MNRRELQFQCDQDWDEMKPTACGRFCTVCNKEVHDLTGKSIKEIDRLKGEKGDLCGVFLPQQLEQDLVPLEIPAVSKLRYFAAFLATFLGLELSSGKAQDKKENTNVLVMKEEKTPSVNTVTAVSSSPKVMEDENGEPIEAAPKKRTHYKKKKYYVSRRFPFIHRRRRVMGMF
jgi:hypothetical protein